MGIPLITWTKEHLKKRLETAQYIFIKPINLNKFMVIENPIEGMVILSAKSYTCIKFDLNQYLCMHAMTACLHRHIEFYIMCSHYYRADRHCATYAYSIYHVGPTI